MDSGSIKLQSIGQSLRNSTEQIYKRELELDNIKLRDLQKGNDDPCPSRTFYMNGSDALLGALALYSMRKKYSFLSHFYQ